MIKAIAIDLFYIFISLLSFMGICVSFAVIAEKALAMWEIIREKK